MPQIFTLFNTLTNRAEVFAPADPSLVTFYSCGPTVYDDAHIGNFRSFLAADLLRRFLESPLCVVTGPGGEPHRGPRRVLHVMNITDVGHMTDDADADGGGEDKMALAGRRIAEAKKAGKIPEGVEVDAGDPRAVARFFTERFLEDARRLGLKVASEAARDGTLMPRASDHIDEMRAVIARLLETGAAYTAGEPGARAVYFAVQAFPAYGELSGNTLDKLRGGAGGRVLSHHQSEKRHAGDFLLWKEDERHLMKWPAPQSPHTADWGQGYPGWHIECTAMSLGRLVPGGMRRVLAAAAAGDAGSIQIDLHSGGEDNIFPHHECENAQSCALTGADRFARHWFHARFLMVEGAKMSKSKGTFYTARDLFAQGHEPATVRLELIKTHYRTNADFSAEGLRAGARTVERLRRFAQSAPPAGTLEVGHPLCVAFAGALHDDLNIAGALGELNKWLNTTPSPTPADAAAFAAVERVLGLLDLPRAESTRTAIGLFGPGVEPDARVESLLAARAEARKAKDFSRADAIRDELAALGLAIKDAPGGKVEVTRR
jgi:cysteinyl-tRNA synthetase